MTTLVTSPAGLQLRDGDSITVTYDATPLLIGGETVTHLDTVCTDSAGDTIVLPDSPLTVTTGGSQRLTGATFTFGETYYLAWRTTTSTGDTMSQVTEITLAYP